MNSFRLLQLLRSNEDSVVHFEGVCSDDHHPIVPRTSLGIDIVALRAVDISRFIEGFAIIALLLVTRETRVPGLWFLNDSKSKVFEVINCLHY